MNTKQIVVPHQKGGTRTWSRLRTRMAFSYIAVTLVIVLLLESLVAGVILYVVTRSPLVGYWAMQGTWNAAQIYALQAAVQADEAGLDLHTTFAPGQATSLSLRQASDLPEEEWFSWHVPYVAPGGSTPDRAAIALLIGSGERVLARSYPDQYPIAKSMPRS